MRVRVDYRSNSIENYKIFQKKYLQTSISFEDWKKIIYLYNDWFREYILETGESIKLPAGIGEISICKRRRKQPTIHNGKSTVYLPVDWVKSREKNKRIYNLNYHTEGFTFKWIWFKLTANFRQCHYWYFKPSRVSSRMLAHYLKIDEKYQHLYKEWYSQINKK